VSIGELQFFQDKSLFQSCRELHRNLQSMIKFSESRFKNSKKNAAACKLASSSTHTTLPFALLPTNHPTPECDWYLLLAPVQCVDRVLKSSLDETWTSVIVGTSALPCGVILVGLPTLLHAPRARFLCSAQLSPSRALALSLYLLLSSPRATCVHLISLASKPSQSLNVVAAARSFLNPFLHPFLSPSLSIRPLTRR